jgi:hypothetical protein
VCLPLALILETSAAMCDAGSEKHLNDEASVYGIIIHTSVYLCDSKKVKEMLW